MTAAPGEIELGTAETRDSGADAAAALAEPGANPAVGASTDSRRADLPDFGPRFEVLRELGHGGMGTVYEVRHRALDRRVAAKLMTGGSYSASQLARFRREAQATSALMHPNILRVTDLDRTPAGDPFIVMELLAGCDLRELLANQGPLNPATLLPLLVGVADALERAHAAGIIHRDLKPDNLFLTDANVLKILDFGVCRYQPDDIKVTREGGRVGTPLYMAPEQLVGMAVTPQADIFALAAVTAELLTGSPVLLGLDFSTRVTGPAKALIGAAGDGRAVPSPLVAPLTRAMATLPADRFPSARAFVDALREAWEAARVSPKSSDGATAGLPSQPAVVADPPAALRSPSSSASRLGVSFGEKRRIRLLCGLLVVCGLGGAYWIGRPWTGASDGAAIARVVAPTSEAAALAPWPKPARLLVLPFAHQATRSVDRVLWPLLDRFLVNALDADERLGDALSRVDPLRVAQEAETRELAAPFNDMEARELAAALDANAVLRGQIERAGGLLRLRATLSGAGRRASLVVEAPDLRRLISRAGAALRERLTGSATLAAVSPERAKTLLINSAESGRALATLLDWAREGEHAAASEFALAQDPGAAGVAWASWLGAPDSPERQARLAQAGAALSDPDLRRFFGAIGAGRAADACAGLDLAVLGGRYPNLIGPLASAACAYERGEFAEALRQASRAFDQLRLRPLAADFQSRMLYYARTCRELLPVLARSQSLLPERAGGWSILANWTARCGDLAEAKRLLRVTRTLLGPERAMRHQIAYRAALVALVGGDIKEARPWLEMLEKTQDVAHPTRQFYFVTALALAMEGREREGLARTQEGMVVFQERPGDDFYMLAASAFYTALGLGRMEDAKTALGAMEARFERSRDVGDGYDTAMARVALEWATQQTEPDAAARRIAALGERVTQALGDLGRAEQATQESLVFARLGTVEQCRALILRPSGANALLGGCRYRVGQALLAAGDTTAAAQTLARAFADMVWSRFLYPDQVLAAMLAWARAAASAKDEATARQVLEHLIDNLRGAPEHPALLVQARQLLDRLSVPSHAP